MRGGHLHVGHGVRHLQNGAEGGPQVAEAVGLRVYGEGDVLFIFYFWASRRVPRAALLTALKRRDGVTGGQEREASRDRHWPMAVKRGTLARGREA